MLLARVPHVALLPRIWQLRHNLSVYDAAYVALAEALGAPLLTADRTLAAVPGLRCESSCSPEPHRPRSRGRRRPASYRA
jgi:predicted nucleic acid-binding protein